MPTRAASKSPAKTIGKREAIYQVWIGVCLGRTRGWNAKMDRRQELERQPSLRQLLNLSRNGREERWQWFLRTHKLKRGEDAREQYEQWRRPRSGERGGPRRLPLQA